MFTIYAVTLTIAILTAATAVAFALVLRPTGSE